MAKRTLLRKAGVILIWATFTVLSAGAEQWRISTLHSFGNPMLSGHLPESGVILGRDMKLYGTCLSGGAGGKGVVFRVNRDGSGFESIHSFSSSNAVDGAGPLAGVLEASDGRLYGTTLGGGTNSAGTIYSLTPDGSDFQVVFHFDPANQDQTQVSPFGELIEGGDGMLYGTTRIGGSLGNGTVFRISKNGSHYEVLHEFDLNDGQGAFPECPLIQGNDGVLYGTANDQDNEGDRIGGKIFKLKTDGSDYQVIHDFTANGNDGSLLLWGLTEGSDGILYGTTFSGGAHGGGILFKLRKDGTDYRVLYAFGNSGSEPRQPFGPLRLAPGGLMYGLTYSGGAGGGGTMFVLDANQLFRVVDTFGSGLRDASVPVGALALEANGNLYGTSMNGGISASGTVFRLSPGRKHSVLHNFNSSGGDGAHPNSPLFSFSGITNFLFFGTTADGGLYGEGTAYQMNFDGTKYKLLRSFSDRPQGVAVDETGSNLYVTTFGPGPKGDGALYRMKQNGNLKLLHRFRGGVKDGAFPGMPFNGLSGFAQSHDGMIYGVTLAGGAAGSGVLYRVGVDGRGYRILHQFDGSNGIASPSLVEGIDGALYGTTSSVAPKIPGSAFKINRDGTGFMTLHIFHPADPGGSHPSGPLLEAFHGVLYGATENSVSPIIYEMNNDGSGFGILHTFSNYSGPVSGLIEENDGSLYGVATELEDGPVFRLQEDGTGFEVVQNLGTSSFDPALTKLTFFAAELGVTTRDGGDMNLGRAVALSPR